MNLIIDDEFRQMCRDIVRDYDTRGAASLIDSDDLYQLDNFCGGWSDESQKFWFSFYAPDVNEYWFSFTLDDARTVAIGGSIDPLLEHQRRIFGE